MPAMTPGNCLLFRNLNVMKTALLLLLIGLLVQDLPFKPKEDFDLKLDYTFKQRPTDDATTIRFDESERETARRASAAMLPHLIIRVNLLKLTTEEIKVRITNNQDKIPTVKKIKPGTIVKLEMGFTDDIKDRVTPHEYLLTFVSADKVEQSRILINIETDGTFTVNGEKRGKF
jgi:hypothetical protein